VVGRLLARCPWGRVPHRLPGYEQAPGGVLIFSSSMPPGSASSPFRNSFEESALRVADGRASLWVGGFGR